MDRCEEKLDRFLGLMSEEPVIENRDESPDEFLLNLWSTDKDCFFHVIRGSLKYMKSSRGMDDCIISVCLSIGKETRELIEEIALRRRSGSKWSAGFLTAAILLGSTKAEDKFKNGFEESFASGVRHHYDYKQAEVLDYLKTTVFFKLTFMTDLIAKLAAMKGEQYHRLNKLSFWGIFSRPISERKERQLNRLDGEPIKFAEAANVYFTKGAAGLKEYLNAKGDSEYREREYLFCLACDRNPGDFEYFKRQYKLYKDAILKSICLEAMLYIGDHTKAATFIDEELGRYDLRRLIKKKGHDFKIIHFWAHDWIFYRLLDACCFLKTLNDGLINKLKVLAEAREPATSTPAMLILEKFGVTTFDKSRIDSTQELLLKTLPSPAHLLSMARASGRL
jgi:hypothetical protein